MKRTVMIIWILILVLLVLAKGYVDAAKEPVSISHWRAVEDLPENHQLRLVDITLPKESKPNKPKYPSDSLVGRHLVRSIKKCEEIKQNDLSDLPVLPSQIEKGYLLWMLPLRKEEIILNALVQQGAWVQLCSTIEGNKSVVTYCYDSVQIIAIHQSRKNKGDQFWLLYLNDLHAREVGWFSIAKNRYILVKSKAAGVTPARSSDGEKVCMVEAKAVVNLSPR